METTISLRWGLPIRIIISQIEVLLISICVLLSIREFQALTLHIKISHLTIYIPMPAHYVLCSVLQVPRHKNLIRSSRFCPRDAVCRTNGRTCVAGVGRRVLGKSMR